MPPGHPELSIPLTLGRTIGRMSGQLRRTVLVAGALGVISLAVALGLIPRFRDGLPLDATAANIVPFVIFDAAVIETSGAEDAMWPGLEGAVLFVRLVDERGVTVVDRPIDWPSDRQPVPPGDYALTAYFRTCSGNCSILDGEDRFCEHDLVLSPKHVVEVHIVPSNLLPGSTCSIDRSPEADRP